MKSLSTLYAVVVLALAGLVSASAPEKAQAAVIGNVGFVCSVRWIAANDSTYYGEHGLLSMEMFTGPHCSGSPLGTKSVYSVGATHPAGPVNAYYLYNEAQMAAAYGALADAGYRGRLIYFITDDTSYTYVIKYFYIYSDAS